MYGFTLKLLGWKLDYKVPKEYSRCVLIGAPHTSNWDFFYTVLSFKALKIPYKFTIKKQWFRWRNIRVHAKNNDSEGKT